jgi:hypothetical protein
MKFDDMAKEIHDEHVKYRREIICWIVGTGLFEAVVFMTILLKLLS